MNYGVAPIAISLLRCLGGGEDHSLAGTERPQRMQINRKWREMIYSNDLSSMIAHF